MSDERRNPFQIAVPEPLSGGAPLREQNPSATPLETLDQMVRSSDIFLLIKGSPEQPMCGFSAHTVAVMDGFQVDYSSFDVLSDDSIRAAAKEYSRWPTFPQVFVRGEFIGGSDIVNELHHSGELAQMLAELRS